MNILFVSHQYQLSAGPAWSIPAKIVAQEKIDNVKWLFIGNRSHHYSNIISFHCFSEFKKLSFSTLPTPFNKPDCVIFEGFYGRKEIKLIKECWKYKIPYIIVPRGSLTYQAMHNKSHWKKEIAHFLFYDKFVNRASAIQYLTKQEYEDSKYRYSTNHFILPNGFNKPQQTKDKFSSNCIKGVFIGRIDIYHKGIDLLFDVIEDIKQVLIKNHFSLTIYGPKSKDYNKLNNLIGQKNIEPIITLGGEILGKEKEKAILDSDIFFLTSRFEGHPMGLLEALSYGLPCIITTGTNMRKEVDEYDAGWSSDFTFEGLKQAILDMIYQKEIFKTKSQNAIKLAHKYEWNILAQKFHSEVEKILENN